MCAGRGQRGRAKRSLNAQARRSTPPNSPSAWSFLAHKPANALPRCMQSRSGRGRGRERVWKSWLAARTSSPLPRRTPPRSSACARTSAKQQPAQQPAQLSDHLALAFDRFSVFFTRVRTRARSRLFELLCGWACWPPSVGRAWPMRVCLDYKDSRRRSRLRGLRGCCRAP